MRTEEVVTKCDIYSLFTEETVVEAIECAVWQFVNYADYMGWDVSPLMVMVLIRRAWKIACEIGVEPTTKMVFMKRNLVDSELIVELVGGVLPADADVSGDGREKSRADSELLWELDATLKALESRDA